MTTRAKYRGPDQAFYDDATFETLAQMSALQFCEDFVGAGHGAGIPAAGSPVVGYPWVKKIVGAAPPTVALVANAAGGQVALTLTSASQKQDAVLYWNDNLGLDVTKSAQFEARAAASVVPSGAGVQLVLGLAAAWIDGPDNNTFYLEFGCTASGALLCRSQDGVTQNSLPAAQIGGAAITLDANFHIFRIACENLADIAFMLDGNRVNAVGSIAFAATGANTILQPYLAVYKPSGTGVATLTVDKVDAFTDR
jgi:hypothetical protein